MKYTTEFTLKKPLEEVIEKFDSFDNLKEWQPDLISYEHLSGEVGKPGAKTKLLYKFKKREMELIETIEQRDLPEVFAAIYEAKNVWNRNKYFFKDNGDGTTHWITESEFQFKGFMKVMSFLMPGAFKKQSKKIGERFKEYVERD
jgi:carbon monoxide dehydrogenase subunit G